MTSQEQIDKEIAENLRTEYSALSSYFATVITFRFTTLGFYLASIGLIVGDTFSDAKALLLIVLSVILWVVEWRNRTLFANLGQRAMQIEREHWGYRGERAYDPLFSHMFKTPPEKDSKAGERRGPDYPRVFGKWTLKWKVSHSVALDWLFFW